MAYGSLSEVVSALNELFGREGVVPLECVETRSDLMVALTRRVGDWRSFGDSVCQCLSQGLPADEVTEWLDEIDKHLEGEHQSLGDRLVHTLVAAGLPVIMDSGVFQEIVPLVDSMDCLVRENHVYGFTCQGLIFLDSSSMCLEAPLHEYAHLWATALRVANPTEWMHVVGLMRGTSVWQELSYRYQGRLSEDRLAEEVLATFSGRRGTEKLRSAGLGGWKRVVAAIQSFWQGVCGLVGIHFDSAEQVADRVLRDFVSEVNPETLLLTAERKRAYTEVNATVRQLFIGEKGAAELDASTLLSARVECLQAANRMEAAGRDAKRIKLATGWERGVDGFWRYELPSANIYDISFDTKQWKMGYTLDKLLDLPELFAAYPALRSLTVSSERMRKVLGNYREDEGILLNLSSLKKFQEIESYGYKDQGLLLMKRFLLHEVQHWIQREEGFAKGGSIEVFKGMLVNQQLAVLREQDKPLFWYYHYFMRNEKNAKHILQSPKDTITKVIREYIQENPGAVKKNAQLTVVADHIESLTEEEYRMFKMKAQDQTQRVHRINRRAGKEAKAMYMGLAGEVEARNVEARSLLSAAQRKGSLGTETMDIPADKQFIRFGEELPTKMAARGLKR